MAPVDYPQAPEATSVRADQHVHIVWIVEDPSYVQPEIMVTSTSSTEVIITQERIEVAKTIIKRVRPDWPMPHWRVEQPLKAKVKPQYARKYCCKFDRKVNKRKTFIKSCQTRKILRYLNYLRKR